MDYTPFALARKLPLVLRQWIYSILITLYGLELIFDWVDAGLENKLVAAAGVIGFTIAGGNARQGEQ